MSLLSIKTTSFLFVFLKNRRKIVYQYFIHSGLFIKSRNHLYTRLCIIQFTRVVPILYSNRVPLQSAHNWNGVKLLTLVGPILQSQETMISRQIISSQIIKQLLVRNQSEAISIIVPSYIRLVGFERAKQKLSFTAELYTNQVLVLFLFFNLR